MSALNNTINEFHDFAVECVAGFISFVKRNSTERPTDIIDSKEERRYDAPRARTLTSVQEDVVEPTFRSAADIISTEVPEEMRPLKNTVMYVGSLGAPLYKKPTVQFDTVIAQLPYGAMVMVLAQQGRWSQVAWESHTGWILRDDLLDRAAHVYPHFVIGERNEADDPNTIRVRALIGDAFAGGHASMPLQSSEYVCFRLMRKGIVIQWPSVRPRVEGEWHTILKGVEDVHIGVRPKTGSIFEYSEEDGEGRVAFVEAVFPDETIHISETNFPEGGIYNERVLTLEEWQGLKPVFIQVS
jgi:hypothetical protein